MRLQLHCSNNCGSGASKCCSPSSSISQSTPCSISGGGVGGLCGCGSGSSSRMSSRSTTASRITRCCAGSWCWGRGSMSGRSSSEESNSTMTTACCCGLGCGKSSAEVSDLTTIGKGKTGSTRRGRGILRRRGCTGKSKNILISRRSAAHAWLRRSLLIRHRSCLLSLSRIGLIVAIALNARKEASLRCLVTLLLTGVSTIDDLRSWPGTQTRLRVESKSSSEAARRRGTKRQKYTGMAHTQQGWSRNTTGEAGAADEAVKSSSTLSESLGHNDLLNLHQPQIEATPQEVHRSSSTLL